MRPKLTWHAYYRLPYKRNMAISIKGCDAYTILRSDTEKVIAHAYTEEMARLIVDSINGHKKGELHDGIRPMERAKELEPCLEALKAMYHIVTHPQSTKAQMRMIADEARIVIAQAEGTRP